jgi:asparagine synthase (glutamine-hydrolysing)
MWIDEERQKALYTDAFLETLQDIETIAPLRNNLNEISTEKNNLNQMLYLEAKNFLADHNLNYTDKMSMATGVEVRVPLLDIDLIDFVTQIPPALKQKGPVGKYIFKKAMEPYLPNDVIYRPKSGFGAPLREWLSGELRDVVSDMLSPKVLKERGIFKTAAVKALLADDRKGKIDASYTIFSMMCMEWWMRLFL